MTTGTIIQAADVGTPNQPIVPLNEIAAIITGMKNADGTDKLLKLPSAAGIAGYDAYFFMVNSNNPGVWGWWMLMPDLNNPDAIALAQMLSNGSIQEWVDNPASGHNTVINQ